MSQRTVDLLFFGFLVVPMVLCQAWLVYWLWRQEKAREREQALALRQDMEETLRQCNREEVPESFRREMMACIPVEHGGTFRESDR